jgi:hypothetical protein
MDNQPPSTGSLSEEIKNLGKNLISFVRSAWESQEGQKLQQEIQAGMIELSQSLKAEVEKFSDSAPGQKIRNDIQNFQEKINLGNAEEELLIEIKNSLHSLNQELEQFSEKLFSPRSDPNQTESNSSENESTDP